MRKNFGAKPYLYPQPVMIIGTYDENGNANAMNAAWGGMAGANKIMIDLSSHKTTDNIQLNRAFTVSVGDVKHLTACDYVGMVSAHNAPDKMEKAGFTTTKSDFVNAPIINELPLTLECELLDVIEGSLYLGEIKNVSMDESILGEDGELDLGRHFGAAGHRSDGVFHQSLCRRYRPHLRRRLLGWRRNHVAGSCHAA